MIKQIILSRRNSIRFCSFCKEDVKLRVNGQNGFCSNCGTKLYTINPKDIYPFPNDRYIEPRWKSNNERRNKA